MKARAIAHSTSWSSSKAVVVAGKRVYRAVGEGALSLSMSMSLSGYVDVDVVVDVAVDVAVAVAVVN